MSKDSQKLDLTFSKTNRGFGLVTFKDLYGDECSLQESSLATEACIWLGMDKPKEVEGTVLGRMHLNQKQAKSLIKLLNFFVKTGYVPESEEQL